MNFFYIIVLEAMLGMVSIVVNTPNIFIHIINSSLYHASDLFLQ